MSGEAQAAKIHRIRLKFERDFTQLPNTWLRDKRLSRGARGLLGELMSHSQEFEVTLEALVASGTEGRSAIRTLVSELEGRGYLHRIRKRRRGGRLAGYDWVLQDPFEGANLTTFDFPTSVEPTSVEPSTVNRTPIEDQGNNNLKYSTQPPRAVDNSRQLGACGHELIDDRHCIYACKLEASA